MGSFKKKKYGMVKPVRVKKEKLKKPVARELASIYSGIAKQGVYAKLDNIAYAMHWYDSMLIWYREQPISKATDKARAILKALESRKAGQKTVSDRAKTTHFITAIRTLEKLALGAGLKVPSIDAAIKLGDATAKKNKAVLDKIQPKHARVLALLTAPGYTTLDLVVVPQIIDGATGRRLPRKYDHTKDVIYYSRDHVRSLEKLLRQKGLLAVTLQEVYYISRAASLSRDGRADYSKWLGEYAKCMACFQQWCEKEPTAPKQLVKRKVKKKKGEKIDMRGPTMEEVEENLRNGEIVLIEPLSEHLQREADDKQAALQAQAWTEEDEAFEDYADEAFEDAGYDEEDELMIATSGDEI